MKEIRKQQLLCEIINILLCIVFAAVLALAIDAHVKQVVTNVINDCRHTEWVKAAHEASEVTLGGYGDNK